MQFTPQLDVPLGCVRGLNNDDVEQLFSIYQQPEIPGQRPLEDKTHCQRMVELSQQMAATQRGMMWILENDQQQGVGVVSIYDWQPSLLKATIRVDGTPALSMDLRGQAIDACLNYMNDHYHVRNFAFQWIDGQAEELLSLAEKLGFERSARLRSAWRTASNEFRDIVQLNRLMVGQTS